MGSKEHRSCAYSPPKEASCREGKRGGDPGTPGQIRKRKTEKEKQQTCLTTSPQCDMGGLLANSHLTDGQGMRTQRGLR